METPEKRRGRPPEGLGKRGEPDRIRDYPRQLFTMRPATKARLKAIAEHENRSEWRVVEDSIALYFDRMTPKDRRAVEAIVRKAAAAKD
jgi:hypothetical protein